MGAFGGSDGSGNCIAVEPPDVVAHIEGFLPFKNQRLVLPKRSSSWVCDGLQVVCLLHWWVWALHRGLPDNGEVIRSAYGRQDDRVLIEPTQIKNDKSRVLLPRVRWRTTFTSWLPWIELMSALLKSPQIMKPQFRYLLLRTVAVCAMCSSSLFSARDLGGL